jgi:hypothetical protein
MFSERTLVWTLSALVLGANVACSDSKSGDNGGTSGSGGTGGGGTGGKGGGAGKGGSGATSGGTAGSSGTSGGTAGSSGTSGGTAGSSGTSAGTAGSSGDAGTGGDAGAAGDGGGGASGAGGDTLCGVRPGGTLWGEHVLRFETAAGDVVQLQRAYDMAGVGESSVYRLDGMGVRFEGEETCMGADDTLEYVNTHHNWYDEAHAEKGERRHSLLLKWDADSTFAISGEGAASVLGPVPVIWTGFPAFCGFSCFQSATLAISEIVANNAGLYPDEADEHEPLIELYNAGSDDVDLSGWTLSNSFSDRDRWAFPNGTMLLRHETVVVFADGETAEGPLHASFELSADGGQVILTAPDGSTDGGFEYGVQAPDTGYAFSWNESGYVTAEPTPGAPPAEPE